MNDLQSFTLCHDDWQLITDSLWEAAADRLSRADAIGRDSTYGSILYAEGQKIRSVADYLDFHLPEIDD